MALSILKALYLPPQSHLSIPSQAGVSNGVGWTWFLETSMPWVPPCLCHPWSPVAPKRTDTDTSHRQWSVNARYIARYPYRVHVICLLPYVCVHVILHVIHSVCTLYVIYIPVLVTIFHLSEGSPSRVELCTRLPVRNYLIMLMIPVGRKKYKNMHINCDGGV